MQGQPSPWAQAFRGFDDWDDGRKQQLVTQYFQAAGQNMQEPKIVPKPNDEEIELRGVYQSYPTRVVCDAFFGLNVEMKAPNQQLEALCVYFDPNFEPTPGDADPWDEDDEVRVFLGKGVYVEDDAEDIDQTLRLVRSMPPEFVGHLCNLMQANALASVVLSPQAAHAAFRNGLAEMWDPMVQLGQVLWLLAYGANVYTALPPATEQVEADAGIAVERVKCKYCGTVYLLTPESLCCNCGAPYTG